MEEAAGARGEGLLQRRMSSTTCRHHHVERVARPLNVIIKAKKGKNMFLRMKNSTYAHIVCVLLALELAAWEAGGGLCIF
jgi:hypothetical protein